MTNAVQADEVRITCGDREFAALAWGPADGSKLLALHGWMDNAASFRRLAPRLDRCRVVALDMPGHGLSPHRRGSHYHFVEYVLDVAAAAGGLGWECFDLIGHSMGAGVATLFAGTFPERVRRLALIDGLGSLSADPGEAPQSLRKAWETEARAAQRSRSRYATFEDGVRARSAGGFGISTTAARLLCERGLEREDEEWVWRNDPRLGWPSPLRLTEEQNLAFISLIDAPVLLIRASAGLDFGKERAARRMAAVRDLTLVELEGGHHLHMEESVDEVAGAVLAHLQ